MATMTMARTNRVRTGGKIACHDACDSCMAPCQIKPMRRRIKRRERQGWRKEVSNGTA